MARIEKFVEQIKNDILGKHYELSFSFVSKSKIKELNKKYRKKNEPTDILSFPLSKNSGEILVCYAVAKEKSKKFIPASLNLPGVGLPLSDYLLFLVIHGVLHLKGMSHGDKMEKHEFTYYSRYRCRHL